MRHDVLPKGAQDKSSKQDRFQFEAPNGAPSATNIPAAS
jgi:hypothetical protein